MRAVNIRVSGEVQGVFFRESAKKVAAGLGLAGFVRNEKDGSVYVEVEGEEEAIGKFVEWCKDGPERAKPGEVVVSRQPISDFERFEIQEG